MPKRTGRKRKRGSSGPFLTEEEIREASGVSSNGASTSTNHTYASAWTVYRSLQDNASTYKISVAGVVDEVHRFRSEYSHLMEELF